MIGHSDVTDTDVWRKIKDKTFVLGGNKKLRIYGTLHCSSGKRMKRENRVFFTSEIEAIENGYRPCGHCMRKAYKIRRNGSIQ